MGTNIRYVIIGGRQYWHYEDADTFAQAKLVADRYKQEIGNKYYILKGEKKYHLFMTKIRKALA